MSDNGGNDRRRDIEGRINTLGTGGNSASRRSQRHSNDDETETDEERVSSGLQRNGDDEEASTGTDADALADDAPEDEEESEAEDADVEGTESTDDEDEAEADENEEESEDEAPFETRATDVDERSSLDIEMDRFVRAFAARRADQIGEDSLDDYIVGSVKGYLAGLLGGDVESPGTLERKVEVEADDIFGGLLDIVADEEQEQDDVVIEAVAEAYDVPEENELTVAGLRDHEALLNGVVANNSNSLNDVSEVVQAAVETRLIEERAD